MLNVKYVINKARDVKLKDIIAFVPMTIAIIISPLFKRYNGVWLVCEDAAEARDNGYWFFKHVVQSHPEVKCIYAINSDSPDFHKVESIGETVNYGSIKHWIAYFNCEYNISSQKGGKPNAAICAFFELNNIFRVKNVFLQHGVTINNARWLYADRSSFTYFITATTEETEYIRDNFGYDPSIVQYTGFSRFDNLHELNVRKNRILIMPSWRAWFSEKTAQATMEDAYFEDSDYLRCWKEFITSQKLNELARQYDLEVLFYPHRNMQKYLEHFKCSNSNVIIAAAKDYDVQELLKSSRMLITDYSSVFFDMIYMKKPIVFYQFDEEKFRKQQYQQGYFDYHNNPFGETVVCSDDLIKVLETNIKNDFSVSKEYLEAHKKLFPLYDNKNSERIFTLLKK